MNIYKNLSVPKSIHYLNRYIKFINSINNIDITTPFEIHHIVPKSMGGGNEKNNLIKLTPRQHYIAHWMLWKAYKSKELTTAFFAMSNQNNPHQARNIKITSKVYEQLKNEFCEYTKEATKLLWQDPIYRAKHITANKTEKTKALRSKKAKELWADAEFREKQHKSRKQAWAEGRVIRDHSKCGVSGENNPSKNPVIVAKRAGDNYFTKREGYIQPLCVHCGKSASPANIKRWHGDNCKLNRV